MLMTVTIVVQTLLDEENDVHGSMSMTLMMLLVIMVRIVIC